jgi:hypothetical protein
LDGFQGDFLGGLGKGATAPVEFRFNLFRLGVQKLQLLALLVGGVGVEGDLSDLSAQGGQAGEPFLVSRAELLP